MAKTHGPALRWLQKAVATLLFAGYSPVAPGTAGSAVTAAAYFFLCPELQPVHWLLLLAGSFAVAVYAAHGMAREWGPDPGPVVVDEAVGFLTTMAFLPASPGVVLGGFLVFRVLDIVKPPPARQLEGLPGGWGIVLDDVMAGVYGNLVLRAILALLPA